MTTTAPRAPLRPLCAAAVLLAALLGLLGGAGPAAAHAVLTGSSPARGAVVDEAPRQVTLTFSEGVSMAAGSLRVLAPDGGRVDTGEPEDLSTGGEIRHGIGLRDGLPDGTYTVAWQAVSADSHPIGGAFTFSVGAPSRTSVTVPEPEPGGGLVGALYGTARYAAYTGYLLLVGGAVFVLACWPGAARVRPVQRLVVAGWVTLAAATIAALLLRGPYTGSGGLGGALDTDVLRAVLETRPGTALVSRLLLLAAAALFVSVLFGRYAREEPGSTADGGDGDGDGQARRDRRDLVLGLSAGGAVVAAGLGATWAMAEHASTGIQTGVAIPADIVHLLAAAAWLGGLAALLTALRWGPPVPGDAVRRFSRLALGGVAVLAVTGLYQSWRQVGSWSALTSTSYGRLLLVKVGLVALLVGVAWFSRRRTARLADAAGTGDAAEGRAEEKGEGEEETAPARVGASAGQEGQDGGQDGGQDARDGATERPAATAEPAPALTPERAAQLARQRAAVDAARRRRERDTDPVRAGLRRSVLAETAVAVAVLAVTTLLTAAEPARTAEAAGPGTVAGEAGTAPGSDRRGPLVLTLPFDTGGPGGEGRARLVLDPGLRGDNTLHVRTTTPGGESLDAPEVRVAFTLPARDIGPLTASLRRVGEGHWSASGLQLPMSGTWQAAVTVRTSDIDQVTERRTFELG